jgi:hypothetical protein
MFRDYTNTTKHYNILCSCLDDINVLSSHGVSNLNHSFTIGLMVDGTTTTFHTQPAKNRKTQHFVRDIDHMCGILYGC